ncbi:hypothetical protein Pmani_034924 [Petrolisthes manimaculis]|uniref:Uncharacterized protein n=1 Tax=Petrolisthes manimaculis TaxID=1843537 RepID=A0AAE1NMN6_9EUCA|nr:hypothetical protein Pmani_034924 [Petrolisthes manimaculis]
MPFFVKGNKAVLSMAQQRCSRWHSSGLLDGTAAAFSMAQQRPSRWHSSGLLDGTAAAFSMAQQRFSVASCPAFRGRVVY